ncbi:MAG TPA: 4Fe-4S binding protein [Sedimentisphaerales bacterium]|nr:4Fe-4S binding protein [Sedimentisphaerales bacterium]
MMRSSHVTIALLFPLMLTGIASAAERFPPPEFETGYELPPVTNITQAVPRGDIYEYLDVAVLAAALALSSYLVLKKRSRRWIYTLMIFSLLYFGFWRKGCVCPIGAIQNVVLSIFDETYAMPITVTLFFVLPLVFTLFFGRTFCAAVCPLGAMQDLVALRPISIPAWLEAGLRLFAYVYLAAAVLFAATGSAFIICRYDPFVSFFRLSGWFNILVLGACILLIGVFVGRPYCRFLCPYGVILRQLSRLSKRRVTITPDECIKCRLCEDSCPFGAIREPTAEWPAGHYVKSKKRLGLLIAILPVLIFVFGWLGSELKGIASRAHSTVRLADRVHLEDAGRVEGTTNASDAFRATGKDVEQLNAEASGIIAQFGTGGWVFGGFVGLVIGLTLISLTVQRKRTDYEADRGSCLACGRCFEYCPRENVRLKRLKETVGGD